MQRLFSSRFASGLAVLCVLSSCADPLLSSAPKESPRVTHSISIRGESSPAPIDNSALLEVSGTFDQSPSVLSTRIYQDGTFTTLSSTIVDHHLSASIQEQILLNHAEGFEVVSPKLDGCVFNDQSFGAIGFSQQVLQINGVDEPGGRKPCQEFLNKVAKQGMTVRFFNVPVLTRAQEKIRDLVLKILPVRIFSANRNQSDTARE
ncbi:hypothetical protein K2X30_10455 [bacterium]|jgi:hypothetical protein|nr:hypothetical protein [bacterium]